MTAIRVQLQYWEMLWVANAGVHRQVENVVKGRKPAHGAGNSQDWQMHVEGCMGEYVIAKHLNIFWAGKGRFRDRDVAPFDVRMGMGHHKRLILYKKDIDTVPFWLVTGVNGSYLIHGWILAGEGKRVGTWESRKQDRPHAYYVEQKDLNSPHSFDVNRIQVQVYTQPEIL